MKALQRNKYINIKAIILLGCVGVGFFAVIWRCYFIQISSHDAYQKKALVQQRRLIKQSARRGPIVDRNGVMFASSVRSYKIAIDPKYIFKNNDPVYVARKVGTALSIDADKLYKGILQRKNWQYMLVMRFPTDSQVEAIRALNLTGVMVKHQYRREYPQGKLASHVVGYTTIDGDGLDGIEKKMDRYLRGVPGKLNLRDDHRGRITKVLEEQQPGKNGHSVVLTIDSVIQMIVEEKIAEVYDKFKPKDVIGIAMNPNTGEIYAMANYPSFDLNHARKIDQKIKNNRILTAPEEMGSLFKPLTIAAAMEGGFVNINDTIDCLDRPFYTKGIGRPIGEYNNHFQGKIKVYEIIEKSSNIGTAKISLLMGKKYMHGMLVQYGMGQKTGIDMGGEGSGILLDLKKWGLADLTRAAYGQGPVVVTPLQMIRAFCCIANGGTMVTPRVVQSIYEPDGKRLVKDFRKVDTLSPLKKDPIIPHGTRVLSKKVANMIVQKAMVAVVETGTAKSYKLKDYQMFGKTGTANIANANGKGYSNKHLSSFLGGAPAVNPQICVLVMCREPDRSLGLGYSGGVVAAGAVSEIIQESLMHLGVAPRVPEVDVYAQN